MAKEDGKKLKSLDDLTPDPRNANQGTERGLGMLEESLRTLGAGRSILVDKNGAVIAGNKTLQQASELGLGLKVIDTDGTDVVAVRRTDIDLDDGTQARDLAYADNRVAQVDLEWDVEQLAADLDAGVDLGRWWFEGELDELTGKVPDFQPVGEDEQGRLDEKAKVKCPECGHEFAT